jgi:hypothetical protein
LGFRVLNSFAEIKIQGDEFQGKESISGAATRVHGLGLWVLGMLQTPCIAPHPQQIDCKGHGEDVLGARFKGLGFRV